MSELMSARERSDLQSLAKMNARVAKADVEAVVAARMSAFEREFRRQWSAQELQVEALLAEVGERVDAINAEIQQRCDAEGVRSELRPRMLSLLVTSQYVSAEAKADMRRLARAELDAAGKRAKVEIDRQTASLCGDIIAAGLTSTEGREMLGRVPSAEALIPNLNVEKFSIRGGGRR